MTVEFLGNFLIDDCQLEHGLLGLEYLEQVDGDFILEMNMKLKNLTGLDQLTVVGGKFELDTNNVNWLNHVTDWNAAYHCNSRLLSQLLV